MKIAAGLVAVLLILLGMIALVGNQDGSISLGEPSETANPVVDSSRVTGEEKAYLEFVINALQSTSTDINTLGVLFSEPAFEDEYWRASTTVLLNRIELAYDAIAPLQPSSRLQAFQASSVSALDHSGEFARIIRGLLVEGTVELTDEAAVELVAAAEAFGEAEGLLSEFLESHTLPE